MTIDSHDTREIVLRTDMPFELPPPPFDDFIPIGSETRHGQRTQYIVVDGVPLHQADLFMHTGDVDWRIRNCDTESGLPVCVNSKPVDGECVIKPGDKVSIGPVVFRLSGDSRRLEIPRDSGGVRIQVDKLTRRTGEKTILDRVSFLVEPGWFVGILGPSGCGKSSLIQTIAGIAPVSDGEILANGILLDDGSEQQYKFRRTCVYLPQNVDNTFHDELTVREEMAVFRSVRMAKNGDESAADAYNLARLGLGEKTLGTRVSELSGGERRRLAIARALALEPMVMLFDEPTAGLDTVSEHDVMQRLKNLAHDGGKTVFCATHVLTRVKDFDRVLLMRPSTPTSPGGKLVFFGTPDDALAKADVCDDPDPWESLYKTLEGSSKAGDEIWLDSVDGKAINRTEDPMPEADVKPSPLLRRIGGYLSSFMLGFIRHGVSAIIPFVVLGVLATILWLACKDGYILYEVKGSDFFKSDCYVFAFCGCLSMFWMGLLNSVGTLVGERVPRRCLDRLDGVSLLPYLTAKIVWHSVMCIVQTFIFAGCLALFVRWNVKEPTGLLVGVQLWFKILLPLLVCSLSGMFIGIAVSSAFTSETRAVEFVPLFAIAQLLLSRVVVNVDDPGMVTNLTNFMPCRWPIDWMTKLLWLEKDETVALKEAGDSWLVLLCVLIVCVTACCVLQRLNEKRWQGR